ncbi:MAG: cobalt-precorrin-8X methylmutase [Oscillatoriales cyanobacterium RM2_1_1]|nr:cobalt-precorrin-8X methylmutase [Oscillatoriales cyanobacterium SM2_3_0]NJO44470.1 cobalt-precorrin-8X methylmutase [Oscillatoriales cyanobacterium RM2_1_1]
MNKIDFSSGVHSTSQRGEAIIQQSFHCIDQEIGEQLQASFTPAEYAILRRVIHATADFEFAQLIQFSPEAISAGIQALQQGLPVITDVNMVKQGIVNMAAKTGKTPVICALDYHPTPLPDQTRTEAGLLQAAAEFPQAIFVIGNAPTALLALCEQIQQGQVSPALVVGVPVGFVSVVESKAALAQTPVPQIRIAGRKGGSPVAAAILNALMILAWQGISSPSR